MTVEKAAWICVKKAKRRVKKSFGGSVISISGRLGGQLVY